MFSVCHGLGCINGLTELLQLPHLGTSTRVQSKPRTQRKCGAPSQASDATRAMKSTSDTATAAAGARYGWRRYCRLNRLTAVGASLVVLSLGLEGCDLPRVEGYFPIGSFDVTMHKVAFWRMQEEIYMKYSYKNPATGQPAFNSCMDAAMNALNVCNGHGWCAPFDKNNIVSPAFFCRCDMGWAGPECNIKQKSQTVAWLLSLVLGPIGADQYYLDWNFGVMMKLTGLTIGLMLVALGFARCGILLVLTYWFTDIVHIGSAPVRARDAKVAGDLPRWAFAVFTLLYFAFLGFAMGVCAVYWKVKAKRRMWDASRNGSYYGSHGVSC